MSRLRLVTLVALLAGALFPPAAAFAAWPTDPAAAGNTVGTVAPNPDGLVACADGSGGTFVVWADQRNGAANVDLYAQRYDSAGNPLWTASGVAIATAAGSQAIPSVAQDGIGGIYVVWQDARNSATSGLDLYGIRLLGNGTVASGWVAGGTPIGNAAGNQFDQSIAVDQNSNLFVVWGDMRNSGTSSEDVYIQKLTSAGVGQWAAGGLLLSNAANDQFSPLVAPDLAGGALVAWFDTRTGPWQVYARTVSSAGVPGLAANGVAVSPVTGNQRLDALVPTNGTAAIIYTSPVGGAGDQVSYRTLSSSGVGFAQTLSDATSLNSVIAAGADGAGGFFLAWQAEDGSGLSSAGPLMVQHVDYGRGLDYGAGGGALFYSTSQLGFGSIVPDGTGGAAVAWLDPRQFATECVYAQRFDRTGRAVWDYGGVPIQSGAWSALGCLAVPDGAGGLLLPYYARVGSSANATAMLKRLDRFGRLGDAAPAIAKVRDVPNDQGGHVSLQWTASYLDALPSPIVTQYSIWRRAPAALANAAPAVRAVRGDADGTNAAAESKPFTLGARRFVATRDAASATVTYWEEIAVMAARALPGYSYTASTTSDSLPGSNPYTAFMVMAENFGGSQYWPSAADSGYSVDNLPPLPPAPVAATWQAGTMSLHWRANGEADVASYRVYRGPNAAFVPGPSNRIADQPDTALADAAGAVYYYKLSAVDAHGNESGFTLVSPSGVAAVNGASAFGLALARPTPNPASRDAELRWSLPASGAVELAVFDASGRRVRTLADGEMAAGDHHAAWLLDDAAGHRVPPGLYLARLRAGAEERVQRIVVTR